MVGKRVVSNEQQEMLVNYVQSNPSSWSVFGWNCAPVLSKNSNKQWTELATILNNAGTGCQKTPRQWRQYWATFKYSTRAKASQRARLQGESGRLLKIPLTSLERKILSAMPPQQTSSPNASDIDTKSSDSSQLSAVPLHVTSSPVHSTSCSIPSEHRKIIKTTFLPPDKYLSAFHSDLSAKSQSIPPEKYSPALKPDLPPKTPPLPPERCSPGLKLDLSAKNQSLPQAENSPDIKPDSLAKIQSPTIHTQAFKVSENSLPLQVAIVTANMSRISFEEIDFIQKELQQRIWDFMANPTTTCQPEFEECSKLEPFGLVFKCSNEDALEWITATIEGSPFKERNLIMFLDTQRKLPTTVDLYVGLTSDFALNKETRSVFDVLARTNKSWLDTERWTLLEDKCLPTSDLACSAKLSLVFRVPLSDIPKLREREFRLHFLFGVVSVDYYEDANSEVSDSRIMGSIKEEY